MSRRIWDIPGGIHPPQNKSQSNQTPIQPGPMPNEIVLPLQQHIGSPANPTVSVGDQVLKGQVIGEATGFVSVPVHASTSGKVIAIEERPVQHPSQIAGTCIVITPDGNDQWIEKQGLDDYTQQDKQEILGRIREAGIAGMGGAGFPSAVKLNVKPDIKIEQLILNAVECEPYITADDVIMRERAAEIVAGLQIIQWLINPQETLIGIEDNKPEAIKAMQAATQNSDIEVVVVPTKYPSGGEKQLIQLLTGKEVPSGGLPSQVGVVCQNVGTAYAINRAINHGEPLVSRITTLTGETINKKGNYELLLGTPVIDVLEFVDADFKKLSRLIMGGPMMGFAVHDLQVPVVKVTNCLLAPKNNELPDPALEQPCIRCGSCAQACPMSLLPQQLYWFAKTEDFEKSESHNIMDCIECGACAFVCPSNIPLVQYYRYSKGQIRVNAEANAKAEHARERFEFRQARLEKEEQEKEAKRKARAEAAAKKQKAKKAPKPAPTAKTEAPATGEQAKADPLTALKSAAASATKRWKDAEKAYKTAQANGTENLEALTQKIEQLKAKANKANEAFVAARKAAKAEQASQPTTDSATAPAVASDDPLAELKAASTADFQAWQEAKKALETADSEDSERLADLNKKVEELKAKSDASKKAMKEARAKQREEIQQQKAAEDPIKTAQTELAAAQKKLEKLEKSKAMLEEKGGDTSKLESSLNNAQQAVTAAQEKLQQAEAAVADKA